MPQTFEVELPDGTTIEGPTKEAVMIAARKRLQVKEAAPDLTMSQASGPRELKPKGNIPSVNPGMELGSTDLLKTGARVGMNILGGIAGGALGGLTGPVGAVVGAAGGPAVGDYLFKLGTNEKASLPLYGNIDTGNTIADAGIDIAGNTALNMGIGKALELLPKGLKGLKAAAQETEPGVKAFRTPFIGNSKDSNILTSLRDKMIRGIGIKQAKGSVLDNVVDKQGRTYLKGLAGLDPTASQYKGSKILAGIEDIFAPTSKNAAVENSATAAHIEAEKLANQLAKTQQRGVGKVSFATIENLPNRAREALDQSFKNSITASNAEAGVATNIASNNKVKTIKVITPAQQVPSGILDASGNPIMTTIPAKTKDIITEGIIKPNALVAKAKQIQNDIAKTWTVPDPNNKLFTDVNEIIQQAQSGNPLDFKTAWANKQAYGQKGFGSPREGVSFLDSRYKELYNAMDQDIQSSMKDPSLWATDGPQALEAYQNAKTITNQRHLLFSPKGGVPSGTKQLLNTMSAPDANVDAIINDYKELRRFKVTGNLKIKGINISQNASLEDLKSYKFMTLMNDAFKNTDPTDIAKGKINSARLVDEWTKFANSESGRELYNSNNRADIGQFFKNIQKIDSNTIGPSRYVAMRVGSSGMSLIGGLGAAVVGGGHPGMSGITGGAIVGTALTLHQVGKLLTNPTTARLLVALTEGGPLKMSTQMASKVIAQALRGQTLTLETNKGTQVEGVLDKDLKFKEN